MKILLTLSLLACSSYLYAQTAVSTSSAGPAAPATQTAMSASEKAVADAERQRFAAQVSKDYAALDKLLADDLVYTHSSGNTDNKASYIQSIRDGKSKYDAIESQEMKVRVYGNTAIINGVCLIKAMNNGETINTRLRYTDVYVKKGNQWQMATWQSVKLAN
ncbi:nuclear transport factor 2 family protein [Spirosoma rhododendri]|uniref:Nuclear transport factor 2 family protein n=1 Tax=Spirosoma rhododendri TaxID=2728024 RepID=A0A7L5DQD6_9BACT|nr:nuclear transport factor 2 family protein [Spirosoma rhododendri]QJD79691.1 nuclear transport factor 2 family protein [Spirosoma rhododendri]